MEIQTITNITDEVANLFDLYRQFYNQPSNLAAAKQFLQDRQTHHQSTLFLATQNNQSAGFTQLYPAFSSVALKPIIILNDLFVKTEFRKQGIAEALLSKTKAHAQEQKAHKIILCTQIENQTAQNLYKKLGFQKDQSFEHYELTI